MVTASLLFALSLAPPRPLNLKEMLRDPAMRRPIDFDLKGQPVGPFEVIDEVARIAELSVAYRADDWLDMRERVIVNPTGADRTSTETFSVNIRKRPAAEVLMIVAKIWDGEWCRIGSTYVMTRRKK